MAKNAGDRSWHSDILPSLTPHTRAYLRLVVLIRKKRNNKVHVLLSERTTWHLPVCEINQAKSVHSTLHAFMVEIFGADVASHRPHGILAVSFSLFEYFKHFVLICVLFRLNSIRKIVMADFV